MNKKAVTVDWRIDHTPQDYLAAVQIMEARAAAIRDRHLPNMVWLLEHPPLYTAGTSAKVEDLLNPAFPVHQTGRGGEYTYHGTGQRIGYVMMDVQQRGSDVRRYIFDLEQWLIDALQLLGVVGERRAGRIGIWVTHKGQEEKIAAIGVRLRKWVAYHGVSLNVNPDLSHYAGIIPCGIKDYGVTSLAKLGIHVTMDEVDQALQESFTRVFL